MRLLIATDAWHPQVNGVVRSLEETSSVLPEFGIEPELLTPSRFRTVPLPTYKEIRVALAHSLGVGRIIEAGRFDAIHIATEGPVGMATRRACLDRGLTFTTSYHTRFPEYLRARTALPLGISYAWLRRFHNAGAATMVSTASLRAELAGRGFNRLVAWSRGVDTNLFRPRARDALDLPGPIFLYVGRLAVEKNVGAFLGLDLPGTKVVVGDGPDRAALAARHPDAVFLGLKTGEELARIYAAADAFVFPSLTDTFGLVLLEALACGVPVAAFPVAGPVDVVGHAPVGVLDNDLRQAALAALAIPRDRCREFAVGRSWRKCAAEFTAHLAPTRGAASSATARTKGGQDARFAAARPSPSGT
ncbi:MAG: glycosyltransferase family 1 protein [Methylobacteriaceae bacterium]|nr:glycosyltransferase family 1 protein [Methylobacteriaceae bacterium]